MVDRIIFLILINISFISCINYLKIPIKYFPSHKYNDSSQSLIFDNIVDQKLYARINIGTPKTEIHLAILFDVNEFFISTNLAGYYHNDFTDLKFYNSSASSSYLDSGEDCTDTSAEYFSVAECKQEVFYFDGKEEILPFYEAYDNIGEQLPGAIGLKIDPKDDYKEACPREKSFFYKMKKINLATNYDWSIFFNSKKYQKEEEGFLLLGCLPHETNTDLGYYKSGTFNEKQFLNHVNMISEQLKFSLNKIIVFKGKDEKNIIVEYENDPKIELNFRNGGVLGPHSLLKYYEPVFENYITNNICFKASKYSTSGDTFFYCKKEFNNEIKKIKENFPTISFQSNDLNKTFILEAADLFLEQGDYVYCLLYFQFYGNDWKIGRPFLKKYQFSFNFDKKYIQYYVENEEPDLGIPLYIFILAIIGTVVVLCICFYLLFKFYLKDKCFRKKKVNELTDDDFEYTSKNDQNKENQDKLGLDIN